MLQSLAVFVFVIQVAKTLSTLQTNSEGTLFSNQSEIYSLKQNISTDNCKVMLDNMALYLCGTTAYMTIETDPTLIFTRTAITRDSVIRGDLDDRSIILVYRDKIEVLKGGHTKEYIQFRQDEKNILARVKSKLGYILVFSLMENEGLQFRAQDQKTNFFVDISVIGRASNHYRMPFPSQELNFELTLESFKDAAIFGDPYYRHDYIILGLEKGWIIVFKTLLQNSETKLIHTEQIEENEEIIEIIVADSFLFVSVKTSQEEVKIKVYRINTHGSFNLEEECTLYMMQDFKTNTLPQLRVKVFQDWITLFINYPGEKLIIHKLPRVEYGYLKLNCNMNYDVINYSNLVPNATIGYSVDHAINPQFKDNYEQGLLLSPFTKNMGTSYFLPYCLPDTKRSQNNSCIKCTMESDSLNTCTSYASKNLEILKTMNFNNITICSVNQSLAEQCISCEDYMSQLGIRLPEYGFWEKDVHGRCKLKCRKGFAHEKIGACLDETEIKIVENPCGQFYDCLNCSISQTCSWSGTSCIQSERHESSKNKTLAYWDDILSPAQKCGVLEPCGQTTYVGSSGTIQYSTANVYKHQLCPWKIQPYEKYNKKIRLTISKEGVTNDNLSNDPELYLQYYTYNITGNRKKYSIINLSLWDDTLTIEIIATELTIFLVNQETIIGKAKNFKIDYEVNPLASPFEDVVILFRWVYYAVFLLAISACSFSAFRDVGSYYRRKRFIQELRAMGVNQDHFVEDSHQSINIDKILTRNKLMKRVALDDLKKIEFNQTECIICLEEFSNEQNLAEFSCKHVFHVECFEKWTVVASFKTNIKCPVCNKTLA